ncbi:putative beta-1,6-glucan biosynthesis protein (Knh1) [Aspergillus lucknowensis]|uniref:Yeast cell wall synthesis Kre9/Knh1 C-terminal domain-containing protein n=1 Tax=Aspergillus lucknowensis TaxID=176173 RepID=A0ABR4M6N6_9EURO
MRFQPSSAVALILTLATSGLARINFKPGGSITGTLETSISPGIQPRMNNSEGEDGTGVDIEKRKVAVDPYTVPYPLQTGPTRYAPVAKKPGTAIPTTSPKPQFPASPYRIATEYLEPGTVETTLTASETLSVTMMENTAAPAQHP